MTPDQKQRERDQARADLARATNERNAYASELTERTNRLEGELAEAQREANRLEGELADLRDHAVEEKRRAYDAHASRREKALECLRLKDDCNRLRELVARARRLAEELPQRTGVLAFKIDCDAAIAEFAERDAVQGASKLALTDAADKRPLYLTIEEQVPLYDAVNAFADAPKLSPARATAVIAINRAVEAIIVGRTRRTDAPATAQRRPECGDEVELYVNGRWLRATVEGSPRAFGDDPDDGMYVMAERAEHHVSVKGDPRSKRWRWPAPASEAAGGAFMDAAAKLGDMVGMVVSATPPSQPRMSDADVARVLTPGQLRDLADVLDGHLRPGERDIDALIGALRDEANDRERAAEAKEGENDE